MIKDLKIIKKYINISLSILIFSILLLFINLPNQFETFSNNFNFFIIIIALINIFFFITIYLKCKNSWVGYETLFLLGYIIVHFQIAFLSSLGIEPFKPNFIWINKKVVNFSTWLSVLAILFWIFGYLIKLKKDIVTFNNHKIVKFYYPLYWVDIFLPILFISFIIFVGKEFLSGSYNGGKNWGFGASYIFLFLRIFIFLKIIYTFKNYNDKKKGIHFISYIINNNKFFFIILSAYFMIFFLAGDRGVILQIIILVGFLYSQIVNKISFKLFLFAIIFGAIFFTILGLGRSNDFSNKNIISLGISNYNSQIHTQFFTDELASSNRILYRSIDLIPRKHPYLYGLTYFNDIIGVIPFGASTFFTVFSIPQMYVSSSYFFTIIGQGKYFTYGEGSEIIGDIYINFGIYGVFILMFALGYFVSYLLTRYKYNNSNKILIIYSIMTIGALYINRSHFLDPLKLIFYALILDSIFIKKRLINE
jgi:hypothetical protein